MAHWAHDLPPAKQNANSFSMLQTILTLPLSYSLLNLHISRLPLHILKTQVDFGAIRPFVFGPRRQTGIRVAAMTFQHFSLACINPRWRVAAPASAQVYSLFGAFSLPFSRFVEQPF